MSAKPEVESSTETLKLPVDAESGVSDDEWAFVDKLKHLEKRKSKVTLERKVKLLDAEISKLSITDDICTGKDVEVDNGGDSRDDGRNSSRRFEKSAGNWVLLRNGGSVVRREKVCHVNAAVSATGDGIGVADSLPVEHLAKTVA